MTSPRFIALRRTASLALAAAILGIPSTASAAEPAPVVRQMPLEYTTFDHVSVPVMLDTQAGGSCAEFRTANEDGNWGPWQKGAAGSCTEQSHALSPGFGKKGIYVQARNAGGESNVVFNKYWRVDHVAIASLGLPETTTSQTITVDPTFDPAGLDCSTIKLVDRATQRIETMDGYEGSPCNLGGRTLTLSSGYGTKTIDAQIVTGAGETAVYTTTINYVAAGGDPAPDPTPDPQPDPNAGPMVLNSISVPATSMTRDVRVTSDYSGGGGCLDMRLATEDGNWDNWQPCKGMVPAPVSAGTGIKGVYVQIKGTNGSLSAIKFAKYRITAVDSGGSGSSGGTSPGPDTTAPELASVTIPATTATNTITVQLSATDNVAVTQVRLANEDGTWGSWRTYSPSISHTLTGGKGYRGVYVQVRDAAKNESMILYRRVTVA